MSTACPLYVNEELRAITNKDLKRDSAVMISSTIPSAKYSCSGSPLMHWNGSTAMDGLSGMGRCLLLSDGPVGEPAGYHAATAFLAVTANARTGSSIVLELLGTEVSK